MLPIDQWKRHINKYGLQLGIWLWWRKFYYRHTASHIGENIFDSDWELLIVLDACRVDGMEELADEFAWIETIETRKSVGTSTYEWMPRTFGEISDSLLGQTAYITANPFTDEFIVTDSIGHLDEVWRTEWDYEIGSVKPKPVTDHAIVAGRDTEFDRYIVHYLQPHAPFIDADNPITVSVDMFGGDRSRVGELDRLAMGKTTKPEVWELYLNNLYRVLECVDVLLSNFDAKDVAITADHGEAFGEGGIYGHPNDVSIPVLYEVPWIETSATDTQTRSPTLHDQGTTDSSVDELLESLGYV